MERPTPYGVWRWHGRFPPSWSSPRAASQSSGERSLAPLHFRVVFIKRPIPVLPILIQFDMWSTNGPTLLYIIYSGEFFYHIATGGSTRCWVSGVHIKATQVQDRCPTPVCSTTRPWPSEGHQLFVYSNQKRKESERVNTSRKNWWAKVCAFHRLCGQIEEASLTVERWRLAWEATNEPCITRAKTQQNTRPQFSVRELGVIFAGPFASLSCGRCRTIKSAQ